MKRLAACMLICMMILSIYGAYGSGIGVSVTPEAGTMDEWHARLAAGDSISINTETGAVFFLTPVCPGKSLILFDCEGKPQQVWLALVDNGMHMRLRDVTGYGVYRGTVIQTDEENRQIRLDTMEEDVLIRIPPELAMPVPGEQVTVYTDGTRTKTIPSVA